MYISAILERIRRQNKCIEQLVPIIMSIYGFSGWCDLHHEFSIDRTNFVSIIIFTFEQTDGERAMKSRSLSILHLLARGGGVPTMGLFTWNNIQQHPFKRYRRKIFTPFHTQFAIARAFLNFPSFSLLVYASHFVEYQMGARLYFLEIGLRR